MVSLGVISKIIFIFSTLCLKYGSICGYSKGYSNDFLGLKFNY